MRRPDGEKAGKEQERKEAKRVDAEDRGRLHHGKGCGEPVSHEVPGQPGQHVAAGELGEAEGDCHRENPCRAWAPQDCGKRRSGGIEQSHAAGEPRHGEGDEPAVPPGLDQKGFGGPIKTGEEIAEAEPESDKRGAAEPRAKPCVAGVAAVEQPDEQAEAQEQHRPDMQRGKGENGDGAREGREQSALPALQRRDPIGCRLHGR